MSQKTDITRETSRRQVEYVKERIIEAAKPRAAAISLALYIASVVLLSISDAQIASLAPEFTKPDLTFGYTQAEILEALDTLGEEGRRAYGINLVIDTIMPIFLAAATLLVAARALPKWLILLGIAPVIFMALDIVENALFGVMLLQYPSILPGLVSAASPITMVKLSAFFITLPTLILSLILLIFRRVRKVIQ
jgi:hypothetical protein